jgi:hypothetical protein
MAPARGLIFSGISFVSTRGTRDFRRRIAVRVPDRRPWGRPRRPNLSLGNVSILVAILGLSSSLSSMVGHFIVARLAECASSGLDPFGKPSGRSGDTTIKRTILLSRPGLNPHEEFERDPSSTNRPKWTVRGARGQAGWLWRLSCWHRDLVGFGKRITTHDGRVVPIRRRRSSV